MNRPYHYIPIQEGMKMKTYLFQVVIEEDPYEDGRMAYYARCPGLEHCYSWGYTEKEALENLQETVKLLLEDMQENGEKIPTASKKTIEISPKPLIAVTV
jgi:predicted RNase H-like HicB family nuclease